MYLIANVLAVRFNSIMIGLMIWALYFCINGLSEPCVVCTVLAVHMEPKAFIFVIPMVMYTMKVNVVNNQAVDNYIENPNIQNLVKEITEKSMKMIGSYVAFFVTSGLIWIPWIIAEDLSGMVNVIKIAYIPETNLTTFTIKFMMFLFIFFYNLRALAMKTTRKIILLTLFNLALGYSLCFTMNADSISVITTCGFLAFYELKEVIFPLIIT